MGESNFDFLKTVDEDLYGIIGDAERLYRGEFFEQCMGQTRRFGEHLCRKVLGSDRTNEVTFDEMLATLKDKTNGSEQEKEFVEDLYFLKKQGNTSVHAEKVSQDGMTAFECLKRAFEASINYAVYYKKADTKILELQYDTELLISGEKLKTLSEKYQEEKKTFEKEAFEEEKAELKEEKKAEKEKAQKPSKPVKKPPNKRKPQVTSMKSVPRKTGMSPFWIVVGVSFVITLVTVIFILL